MKKIVSLVLAISMVLSMFVSAFAATTTFDDVKDTKYAGAVEALVELDVIGGFPDGTFKPEEEVTRAQLAKMLVICLGLGDTVEALEGKTVFSDVDENHWASGYINAAVQSKMIAGYPDGTFKPEKEVSYAEAVTMVIRALGYGNVVDSEGVWPTAYMLKAIELELLDDMGSPKSGEAALRGNVAILLWNMLRTPMWKIVEESEGNGMTSKADSLMLNVKFPDYKYVEDAYLASVSVDNDEVTAIIAADNLQEELGRGALKDVDLSRLVIGMKVSALIKDYKDKEDATFLTLTPAYTFVEGLVTKEPTATKVEIEGVEYKLADANRRFDVDEYVVVEVDGKKVVTLNEVPVAKVLPTDATEVEKLKSMEKDIDEEAIVIIDGEWATREDIELGDMYTAMDEFGDEYYMVARERVEGTFESLTREKDNEENLFIEVDGEKYRSFENTLNGQIYEGEDNDEVVDIADLEAKEKDNKYLDKDVELVLNYLGQVVKVYFGEVSELDADGEFYVVMSNGVWSTSSASGKQYHIVLTGVDGEEETYDFAKSAEIPEDLEEDAVYASGDPIFVWANLNDNGQIKNIVVLSDGRTSGDCIDNNTYKSDMDIFSFSGDLDDDNYLEASNGRKYKATASTIVVTATPVEDDDEKVIGFEVEVSQGTEALDGVKGGLLAYDTTKTSLRAKFVFVAEDAKSQDLNFGKVEKVRQSRGIVYATISDEEYEVDLEDSMVTDYPETKALVDLLVAFTEDDGKITLKKAYANTDLDGAAVVTDVDDEFVTYEKRTVEVTEGPSGETVVNVEASGETTLDVTSEDVVEAYKKYTFVRATADTEKDSYKVVFDADVEDLGKGIENATFKKGDRISIDDDDNKIVVIVSGFKADENILHGELVVE